MPGRFRWSAVPGWLREAVPLGLGDMLRHPNWQLDTILLGFLQPPAVVGLYSVAYRPHTPLEWVPRSVLNAHFPSVTRLAAAGPGPWVKPSPAACACSGSSVCPWRSRSAWAEPLVVLLAGPEYLEAALPMRLLIWKTALMFLSTQYPLLLRRRGAAAAFARLAVLAFSLEAVLMLALIPRWGYLGAFAGRCWPRSSSLPPVWWLVPARYRPGQRAGALRRQCSPGAMMGAVLWAGRGGTWWQLPLVGGSAAVVYLLACIHLGIFRKDEVRHLKEAVTRRFG